MASSKYRWLVISILFLLAWVTVNGQELFPTSTEEENIKIASTQSASPTPEPKITPDIGACYINNGFSVGIRNGIYQLRQKGSMQWNSEDTPGNGTKIDLRDDLDLDRYSTNYLFGADLHLYGFRVSFDYTRSHFSGRKELTRQITIDDTIYNAGISLASEVDFHWYKFSVGYTIWANQYIGAGPSLRMDYIKWKYDFRGTDLGTGITQKERESGELGSINPGIHVDFSFVGSFVGTFSIYALVYKQDGFKAEQAHVSFNPRLFLNDSVFLYGEFFYEYTLLEANRKQDLQGELTFHAWAASLGLGIRF